MTFSKIIKSIIFKKSQQRNNAYLELLLFFPLTEFCAFIGRQTLDIGVPYVVLSEGPI